MNKLDIKSITTLLEKMDPVTEDTYLAVYPDLIEAAKKLNDGSLEGIIAVAHMVYGWMPTILTFDREKLKNISLHGKINNGSIDRLFLTNMKGAVNNSIVGVSKLLHFLNPDVYAIWDSRVYHAIFKKNPYGYRVNNVEIYIQYIVKMRALIESKEIDSIQKRLIELGYCSEEASKMRCLELILFYNP